MDNVSFAIGIARAMGSNRNSHPSGGLSCVAPLLFSRVLGHHSDPYRTPFQSLGKLSDITSESLSDIHRNTQADAITSGRALRPMLGSLEEGGALGGFMAELMTEDAESAWGIIKAAGDLGGRQLFHKIGTEGFVLAVKRGFGSEKELGLARVR